jgi:hypothetical protein
MPRKYPSLQERLLANSKQLRLHEYDPMKSWSLMPCRIWTGAKDGGGYGKLNVRSRLRYKFGKNKGQRKIKIHRAHRMSLALHLGVPIWMLNNVAHACDNKPCIEPTHLSSWTQSKNMQDMIRKGRGKNQFSSEHQPMREAA